MICSCLICRNLLAGFKTCMEIGRYMHEEMPNGSIDENGTFVAQYNVSITNIHFPSFYVAFI